MLAVENCVSRLLELQSTVASRPGAREREREVVERGEGAESTGGVKRFILMCSCVGYGDVSLVA
jgi:hypothetical protein